jgi:hypothetical protein
MSKQNDRRLSVASPRGPLSIFPRERLCRNALFPFRARKSPLAPPFDSAQGMLFQREVVLWDREELGTKCKKFSLFQRGIKGGFSEHLDGNRSWLLVEPMNSIATQSAMGRCKRENALGGGDPVRRGQVTDRSIWE